MVAVPRRREVRGRWLGGQFVQAGAGVQDFRGSLAALEGQGAEAAAGAVAAQGMRQPRSLMERNPCMVDSLWIPVDDGVSCGTLEPLSSSVWLADGRHHPCSAASQSSFHAWWTHCVYPFHA